MLITGFRTGVQLVFPNVVIKEIYRTDDLEKIKKDESENYKMFHIINTSTNLTRHICLGVYHLNVRFRRKFSAGRQKCQPRPVLLALKWHASLVPPAAR